jgi:hypothetical protein
VHITIEGNDPYASVLNSFFYQQFPYSSARTADAQLDAIANELIGTGQVRFGPKPNPESLVAIRAVIKHYIDRNEPIAVLVPFGGVKANFHEPIDIAELATLKTLECLNDRVKMYYEPGLQIRIRIEDTNAKFMFRITSKYPVDALIDQYSEELSKLVRITGMSDFITPVKESDMLTAKYGDEEDYYIHAKRFSDVLYKYMEEMYLKGEENISVEARESLLDIGWRGTIPREQSEYYLKRYETLYPNEGNRYYIGRLAEYFGGALVRYHLGARGDIDEWSNKFIDLKFVPPVPGVPKDIVNTSLYYRSIPMKYTRDHVTPWRGKGYLRISNNQATPAITSFRADMQFQKAFALLSNDTERVALSTDYVVLD